MTACQLTVRIRPTQTVEQFDAELSEFFGHVVAVSDAQRIAICYFSNDAAASEWAATLQPPKPEQKPEPTEPMPKHYLDIVMPARQPDYEMRRQRRRFANRHRSIKRRFYLWLSKIFG